MAATCASCGKKLGLMDRMGGKRLCDDCGDKRARAQQDAHDALLADARRGILPSATSSRNIMNLASGELVHYEVTGAQLMKVARSYQRTGGGVSIPIGKTGIRTYVGQSRGRVVTTGIEVGDTGTFVLTSQRCIFTGTSTTELLDFRNLLDIKVFEDGLQFHRYNRKTPILVQLERGTTELFATLLDVAAQKRLGTWVGPREAPDTRPAVSQLPPNDPDLDAKRKTVARGYLKLKAAFLAAASPEMFEQLAGKLTAEGVVAQEALRIATSFAAVDSANAREELSVMADLFGRLLPDTTPEEALNMVRRDSFKEVFKDRPLDGKILYVGSLAGRDALAGTRTSREVAGAVLEFARMICAVDDHIGDDELKALSTLEEDLRSELSSHGIPWSDDSTETAPSVGDVGTRRPRSAEEILDELQALVGVESVKQEVRDIVNLLRMQKLRKEQGLPVGDFTQHLIFAGSPGTGKTTVARLMGDLYAALKVVPRGQVIEASRAELVAGYSGQTAIKTTEVMGRAMGGVLFIDEAYSLDQGDQDSFGQEALDTLVRLMEDHREELVVFAAGYTDRMERFVDANPGLASRFKRTLVFEDYSTVELVAIFASMATREGYEVDVATLGRLRVEIESLGSEAESGNARLVRHLFESAVIQQANRLSSVDAPTKDNLVRLLPEDINRPVSAGKSTTVSTPVERQGPRSLVAVTVAGREVSDALATVIECVNGHAATIRQYDFADRGDPNALSREEVVRTRVIASRISEEELEWFLEMSKTAPWAVVPSELDLALCDASVIGEEYDAANRFYMHFFGNRPKGVSMGKVHKVLHVKRPDLYPILDSRLQQLYLPAARSAAEDLIAKSKRWSGIREHYWEAIRLDLVRNRDSLKNLRDQLRSGGDAGNRAADLRDLRLLDILTWSLAS
ncbi:MAG: AAA family ATPase [Actinobacteria bacterium]|nr:AAA family ATPase [Actinomycetota bacterium]